MVGEGKRSQTFRANVGIVVVNDEWDVLALDRIDEDELKKSGVVRGLSQWQMPQGGLDEGEEPDKAWRRELREETHIADEHVNLIASYPEWLAYELPKEVRDEAETKAKQDRGQVQKWYFVKLDKSATIRLKPDPEKNEHQEFAAYKWTPLTDLAKETWEVRRPIYEKLAQFLSLIRIILSQTGSINGGVTEPPIALPQTPNSR